MLYVEVYEFLKVSVSHPFGVLHQIIKVV